MKMYTTTDTIRLMHHHSSVRSYTVEPLPTEMIESIVTAAQRSATSSKLQMWSAVAVTDSDRRARLTKACGNQAHIAQAPVFIAWCADLHRLDVAASMRGYDHVTGLVENLLVAAVDVAIAAQTAALAAESLGVGVCYIGAIRNEPLEVVDILRLPRLTFPIVGMTLGWPTSRPKPKPRLPLAAVLHWETYHDEVIEPSLLDYDATMIATGIYEGRQVSTPGKPEVMEDYGWLEHSARRVSVAHRAHLRAALADLGFALE
jgi:FMN reductase (NADPH)